jgi:hypothetical protein
MKWVIHAYRSGNGKLELRLVSFRGGFHQLTLTFTGDDRYVGDVVYMIKESFEKKQAHFLQQYYKWCTLLNEVENV